MHDQSDSQGLSGVFIGLGVLLVVLGTLFSVGQAAGFDLGRFGWPFFVIIPGLAVLAVGLAVGDPTGGRITPLGAVTMVGVILLYQNAADHFESWAYAWALVFPTSAGPGRMVYGSVRGSKEMVATGGRGHWSGPCSSCSGPSSSSWSSALAGSGWVSAVTAGRSGWRSPGY
jgi:hypothetical protein